MGKLYYEALSKIPKRFIHDDTKCIEGFGKIIIANPKYVPAVYYKGKWKLIKLPKFKMEDV